MNLTNTTSPDWSVALERIAKLEKHNRRLKRAGIVAAISIVSFLFMGQAPVSRQVEANVLVLKDASGNVRASLFPTDDGSELILMNKTGSRALVDLFAGENESGINFYDGKQRRIMVSLPSGQGPSLVFADANGKVQVGLSALPDGSNLTLMDGNGKPSVELNYVHGQGPSLDMRNDNGKPLRVAP